MVPATFSGVFLDEPPLPDFPAERIVPFGNKPGNHIYVTDGIIAFDHHGYSLRSRLLAHHTRVWRSQCGSWQCRIVRVDFDLLSTGDLNARRMLVPDGYFHDPVPRARVFLQRRNHLAAAARARSLASVR